VIIIHPFVMQATFISSFASFSFFLFSFFFLLSRSRKSRDNCSIVTSALIYSGTQSRAAFLSFFLLPAEERTELIREFYLFSTSAREIKRKKMREWIPSFLPILLLIPSIPLPLPVYPTVGAIKK